MPKQFDPTKFRNVLPYASELFGVYQPLLGWKSNKSTQRFRPGILNSKFQVVDALLSKISPETDVHISDFNATDIFFEIIKLNIGKLNPANRTAVALPYQLYITGLIEQEIITKKLSKEDPNIWDALVKEDVLTHMLDQVRNLIIQHHKEFITLSLQKPGAPELNYSQSHGTVTEVVNNRINLESKMAGALNYLYLNKKLDVLVALFFPEDKIINIEQLDELDRLIDPMENFDPKKDIGLVSLSPVGMVHLFRQYFFEFDTFLGPPVQHIWVSPGATIELMEIHTRKQTIERTVEASTETILKSEKSSTQQDELSDAIKDENQSNDKFGISVNAGGSVSGGLPGVYSATGHVDTTTSYGLETNQKTAKETTHKQMRQQSDKLSSEIKNSFKTTFKTITEVTDINSKRYVLQNSSPSLINYELRRKMRQVGVQVQDIGTSLCWQTYVDLPGADLGISNLVHIAEPPDLAALPHPQQPAMPENITKDFTMKIFFQGWVGDNDTNNTYIEHGPLSDECWAVSDGSGGDRIHANYPDYKVESIPGYTLQQVVYDSCVEGKIVDPQFFNILTDSFSIHLKKVNFDGDAISLKLKLIYTPDANTIKAVNDKYQKDLATYDNEKARLAKEAFIKSARERIKLASNIQPRKFEELREEERTIVYRHLISSLLNVGVDLSNANTRHVMAELISSLFDVDKMLFFVAPEWWMPRQHNQTFQNVGGNPGNVFKSEDVVSWGGAASNYRPNYFITDESAPAKLGSSLGWILQLDGDNLRNAFLNAPWVKAVIPIRAGKELAALNWLTKAHVEGADGLGARYQPASQSELDGIIAFLEAYPFDNADPRKARYQNFGNNINNNPAAIFVTIEDALVYLTLKIKTKHEDSNKKITETVDGVVESYLPTDKVFEHGFDPLAGGFTAETTKQFEVFDQWVEVLPTDQVVAVEVSYDPKTGRQL